MTVGKNRGNLHEIYLILYIHTLVYIKSDYDTRIYTFDAKSSNYANSHNHRNSHTFLTSRKFDNYEWLQILIIIIKNKRDMITVCILAHGGPNKTIQLSDLRVFKLADLINVSYCYHL